MNNKKTSLLLFLILTVVLSGCNFSTSKEESVNEQKDIAVATIVAQTLAVSRNKIQPSPTPPIEEVPTLTAMPALEVPAQTQFTAAPVSSYNQEGCLIASTVRETIPDNTIFVPGTSFNKTWTMINSGTCEWTTDFQMVYLSGYQMEGVSPTFLSTNVPAGKIIDITLPLKAPAEAGTYRSDWALQAEDGTMVAYLWVQIICE